MREYRWWNRSNRHIFLAQVRRKYRTSGIHKPPPETETNCERLLVFFVVWADAAITIPWHRYRKKKVNSHSILATCFIRLCILWLWWIIYKLRRNFIIQYLDGSFMFLYCSFGKGSQTSKHNNSVFVTSLIMAPGNYCKLREFVFNFGYKIY